MHNEDALNAEEAFGDLTDPRSRMPAHDLIQMRLVTLCSILSGTDIWIGIELWDKEKLDWLRRHIALGNAYADYLREHREVKKEC